MAQAQPNRTSSASMRTLVQRVMNTLVQRVLWCQLA
jgi:hypothetical protein